MSPVKGVRRWTGVAAAIVALACLCGAASEATAQNRSRNRPRRSIFNDQGGRWDDFGWTIQQLQRDRLSSQEEMNREAGRQVRRNELEQERQAAGEERADYFDALLEASRASLRAPQGAYYRKPGWVSTDPPGPEVERVSVGGVPYLYERGVFWLPQGDRQLAVTPPIGAIVTQAPPAAYPVAAGQEELLYSFGGFYRPRTGGYEVVRPAAGVIVSYVPDGYTVEQPPGGAVYRFGEIAFKPVFVQGVLLYRVAAEAAAPAGGSGAR